jgi:hypothetical protein
MSKDTSTHLCMSRLVNCCRSTASNLQRKIDISQPIETKRTRQRDHQAHANVIDWRARWSLVVQSDRPQEVLSHVFNCHHRPREHAFSACSVCYSARRSRAVAHSQGPSKVLLETRNESMGANQAQTCLDEVLVTEGLVTLRSDAIDHGLVHHVLAWSISPHGISTVK